MDSTIYVDFSSDPSKKAKSTTDNNYLFILTSTNKILRIDLQTYDLVYVTDSDGSTNNQYDFHLFDAQYDRFIAYSLRNSTYYLQLRKISDLSLVNEVNFTLFSPSDLYGAMTVVNGALNFFLCGLDQAWKLNSYSIINDTITSNNQSLTYRVKLFDTSLNYFLVLSMDTSSLSIIDFSTLS